MSYNVGADIVPYYELQRLQQQLAPRGDNDFSRYARFQRLTTEAAKAFVFAAYDGSYIAYGVDSTDFPLCLDYARVCVGDCLRAAIKAGFAARPAIFVLEYTQSEGRHAIVVAFPCDGPPIFYDPQLPNMADSWRTTPDDCKSLDGFGFETIMFARFDHARFNGARFNENANDSDSILLKDFAPMTSGAKTFSAVASRAKTFSALSSLPKPYPEVAG